MNKLIETRNSGLVTTLSLFIALLMVFYSVSPVFAADSVILGTDGSGASNSGANYVTYKRALAGNNYVAHSLRVYSRVAGNLKIALYNGTSSAPTSLIVSTSGACSASAYNTFTIADTNIINGQYYWIGVIQDTAGVTSYNAGGSTRKYKAATYSTFTFPSTFDNTGFTDDAVTEYITAMGVAASAPTITTDATSSIGETSATLNGSLDATGEALVTFEGFEWGTTSNNTLPAAAQYPLTTPYTSNWTQGDASGYSTGDFSHEITGLSGGTTYYFRAYGYNFVGHGWSAQASFTTLPSAPTNVVASTTNVSAVRITWTKSTSATAYYLYRDGAEIASLGDVDIYNDSSADAPTITAGTASASDGTSATHVTLSIAGESANDGTHHSYKVRCSSAAGNSTFSSEATGYKPVGALNYQWYRSAADSDASFGVLAGATTDPYNDTTGVVDPDGRYYYCYLTASGATAQNTTHNRGYISASVTALSTDRCTGFTSSSGILNATLLSLSAGAITSYGFDYGLTTAYGSSVIAGTTLAVGESYWYNLTGLTAGTVYHFRAKAFNGVSWGYGSDMIFSTKGSPVIYEYLNSGGDGDSAPTYYANMTAMQFTCNTTSHTITSVRLPLKKVGSTPGTATAYIYHADGSYKPTGSPIAYGTLNANYVSSTAYSWYEFTLTSETNIQANQPYAIVLKCEGDIDNYLLWQTVAAGGLGSAVYSYSVDGGISWTVSSPKDALFEIWGNSAIQVLDAKVFQSYNSSGDWLVCAEVQNTYLPYYPNTDASLNFSVELISGSTIVASVPLREFGRRPIAILLNKATADTLTWGNSNLKIRVRLNGSTTQYYEYAFVTADWQAGGNTYVDNWVRYICADIQDYDTTLTGITQSYLIQTNQGKQLTYAGGQMFTTGIPKIMEIRHNLFQVVTTSLVHNEDTSADVWSSSHVTSDMIGSDNYVTISNVSKVFGMDAKQFIAFLLLGIGIFVIIGMLGAGHAIAGLIIDVPLFIFACYIGVVPVQLMLSLVIIAIVAIAYALIAKFAG